MAAALRASRPIQPQENNWNLFATIIEVAVYKYVGDRDEARLVAGLKKFQDWYVGDGCYGDGPEFHWDYYNSFVIHPMLVETLDIMGGESEEWRAFAWQGARALHSLRRHPGAHDFTRWFLSRSSAASIAYRCGAFHVPRARVAATHAAGGGPAGPGAGRIELSDSGKHSEAPGTFDDKGWLRIGLAGHQPGLGETYISTGSPLPLQFLRCCRSGLPATDPFWSTPAAKTTLAESLGRGKSPGGSRDQESAVTARFGTGEPPREAANPRRPIHGWPISSSRNPDALSAAVASLARVSVLRTA